MRTYIATVVLNVADDFKDRKANRVMVTKFVQDRVKSGAVDEVVFRDRVCLDIEDVKVHCLELSK